MAVSVFITSGMFSVSGNALSLPDGDILTFGGTTASFPAIRRSGATLQAVLADESALTALTASTLSAVTLSASARAQLAPTAFASLPVGAEGDIACVTDSNTATWGATIAGGGANNVLAHFNGTNWTVAGA